MNFKSYFGKASEVTQPCRYFDKFWEMASRENGTSRTELDRHLDPRIRQTFYTPWNGRQIPGPEVWNMTDTQIGPFLTLE